MKEQGWADIILTDVHGNISETHISNIFWLLNDEFYTPSLKTGCIEGVMRNHLVDGLGKLGHQVKEVEMKATKLREAQILFSTNASGISIFKSMIAEGDLNYSPPNPEIIGLFKQLLQL